MENLHKFEYVVELREGYRPTMETENKNELIFVISAKNRATADRAVKAMLAGASNVVEYSGICIE